MASVKTSLCICNSDIELELKEIELWKNKAIAKSKFTQYRLDVLLFLDEQDRQGISDGCKDMVYWLETAMTVMASLSDLLIRTKTFENGKRVATEIEKAKRDFETAFTAARNYLQSQRDGYSSFSAEPLPTNLVMKDSISDKTEESSELNRTKSKLSRSMKLDDIPQDSTGITNDTHSCVTEGNRSGSKKRSESRTRTQSTK